MKYLPLIILAIVAMAFIVGCTTQAPVTPAQQATPNQANSQPAPQTSDQQVVADAGSQVDSSLIGANDSVDIGTMV